MTVIAYHGTTQNFDSFKLPDDLYSNGILKFTGSPRQFRGLLGVYFTGSYHLAKCFTKKQWTEKNSPYLPGARIITARLTLERPREILPIEAAQFPFDIQAMQCRYYYYKELWNYDSVIIAAKKSDEQYAASTKDQTKRAYICEYIEPQYIIFDPTKIEILDNRLIK